MVTEPRFRLPIDDHVARARRDEDKALVRAQKLFVDQLWGEVERELKMLARMDPNAIDRLEAAVKAIKSGR